MCVTGEAGTIVISFVFSLLAILLAQWIWGYLTRPRIVLSVKGMGPAHHSNKVKYFKLGIRNEGATAAKNALVRIKANELGKNGEGIEVVPKWDAVPEASISGNAYLYDASQRIALAPGGIHEELVPMFIIPTAELSGYKVSRLYLFSNMKHYSAESKDDIEVKDHRLSGTVCIDSENCYVKYEFKVRIEVQEQRGSAGDRGTVISFEKLEPKRVKWWAFSRGKVEK